MFIVRVSGQVITMYLRNWYPALLDSIFNQIINIFVPNKPNLYQAALLLFKTHCHVPIWRQISALRVLVWVYYF